MISSIINVTSHIIVLTNRINSFLAKERLNKEVIFRDINSEWKERLKANQHWMEASASPHLPGHTTITNELCDWNIE